MFSKNTGSKTIERAHEFLTKLKDKEVLKEITSSSFLFRSNTIGIALLNNKDELIMTYDFLTKLQQIAQPDLVSIEYDFMYKEGVLEIKSFKLNIGKTIVANVDFDKISNNRSFISSGIIDFAKINNRQVAELRKVFKNNKTVFSFIERYEHTEQNSSVVCYYFIKMILHNYPQTF